MEIRLLNADEIEVKIKQVSEKGAVALLYKTARVDMSILDETFGATNWESDYKEIKGNLYCGIGVRESAIEPFVWKWNCGTESREDGDGNEKKGEASDAFKRAGFLWGIGRELYGAPFIFLHLETVGDKNKYYLKDKYASFSVDSIIYDNKKIKSVTIIDNKGSVVFGKGSQTKSTSSQNDLSPKPAEIVNLLDATINKQAKPNKTIVRTEINQVPKQAFEAKTPMDVFKIEGAEGFPKQSLFVRALELVDLSPEQGGRIITEMFGQGVKVKSLNDVDFKNLIHKLEDVYVK